MIKGIKSGIAKITISTVALPRSSRNHALSSDLKNKSTFSHHLVKTSLTAATRFPKKNC